MTLMLGLSFLVGTTMAFAQDKTSDTTKTSKKSKKGKKAKKTTEEKK